MSVSIDEQFSIQEHDAKLVKAKTPGVEEGIPGFNIGSSCSINSGDGLSSSSILIPPCNIEQHCRLLEVENQSLKDTQIRHQQQCTDAQRRERILIRRLANKEQELQDYVSQIAEYKAAQAPGNIALRQALLDPAVNLLIENLKKELQATKAKLEETQNELSAWKFTPDSNTGKRLMAKCRLLYQENEELGKMTSNGRLAKLENELAMQKSFSDEVKKSQSELDDFLQELDEDVEGMQSTILYLQQELKTTRDRIQFLEKENLQLKNSTSVDSNKPIINGQGTTEVDDAGVLTDEKVDYFREINENIKAENSSVINTNLSPRITKDIISATNLIDNKNLARSKNSCNNSAYLLNNSKDNNEVLGKTGENGINNDVLSATNMFGDDLAECNNEDTLPNSSIDVNKKLHLKKRNYESDSSGESCSTNGGLSSKLHNNKKLKKKTRRSSVLSIDLNEEDTKIAASDEDDCTNQRLITRRKSTRSHQNAPDN